MSTGYGLWRRQTGPNIDDTKILNPSSSPPSSSFPSHLPPPHSSSDFPSFQSRQEFGYDKNICWYPSHMSRASVSIMKQLPTIDAVVEVRDCRAPLTTANYFLTDKLHKTFDAAKRLVVLNKADLVDYDTAQRSKNLIQSAGLPCLLTDSSRSRNVVKVQQFVLSSCVAKYKSLGLWFMVLGLPNTGKSSLINALKRMSFATAKYSAPGNTIVRGVTRAKAASGLLPGLTKQMSSFQISNEPKLYCVDTPGIMVPKQSDPDISLRLAALGCIDDHWTGEMYIGDYILYNLNKRRMFDYVDVLEMPEPSDDIQMVASHISQMMQRTNYLKSPQSHSGVTYFIRLFRNGHFGSCCFDELPDPSLVRRRGDDGFQNELEPPGPWGPRQFADPLTGLR
eukprot:GHVS01078885.1.p1 GENE.GHVS01078885.1~~GHVS01078885.1.p1  ORF type:complete len:394 (+),score=44.98 GHVS01078885.1:326-1507(+)